MDKVCREPWMSQAKGLLFEMEVLATRYLLDGYYTALILGGAVYQGVIILHIAHNVMDAAISLHKLCIFEMILNELKKGEELWIQSRKAEKS